MPSIITYSLLCIFAITFAITVEACSWQSSKLGFPANAVLAGYVENKQPLFVGRAVFENAWVMGTVLPSNQTAYVTFITEYERKEWEYLVCDCYYWAQGFDGVVPPRTVGAVFERDGRVRYVGRKYYKNSLISGNIDPIQKNIYFPTLEGTEKFDSKYEALVSCEK